MLKECEYCDKDTAFALQELGYNPYMFYDDGTPAIHLWYAQQWLREEKNILVIADRDSESWYYAVDDMKTSSYEVFYSKSEFDSYEEALSEGIKEAVKILKGE